MLHSHNYYITRSKGECFEYATCVIRVFKLLANDEKVDKSMNIIYIFKLVHFEVTHKHPVLNHDADIGDCSNMSAMMRSALYNYACIICSIQFDDLTFVSSGFGNELRIRY